MTWGPGVRGIPLVASAAAGVLLLAACDGGDIDAEAPSVASMLELVPADVDTEQPVMVNVYSRTAEQFELTVPEADAADGATETYFRELFGNAVDSPALLPSTLVPFGPEVADVRDEFGYAPQAISADIHAGAPPTVSMAAVGEFSAEEVTDATIASFGAEETTSDEVDGVPVVRWLDDNAQNLEQPHALSQLGQSGRLGVADDQALLFATTDAIVDNLVAAYQGDTETLADNDDLVQIAETLDEHDVRSAALSDTPVEQVPEELSPEQREAAGASSEGIGAYRAYGAGITGGPGGSANALVGGGAMPATGVQTEPEESGSQLVLVFLADGDADGLAQRIEQVAAEGSSWRGMPWSEYLTNPSVNVDGSVVTATFDLMNTAVWSDLVLNRDSLLYSG